MAVVPLYPLPRFVCKNYAKRREEYMAAERKAEREAKKQQVVPSAERMPEESHAPWCRKVQLDKRMNDEGTVMYDDPCNCGGKWNA